MKEDWLTKRDLSEDNGNTGDGKINDFTGWKVNPSIFNFFKTRRQFCERVDNFEEIEKMVDQTKPTEFNADFDEKTKESGELDNQEYVHNNDELVDDIYEIYKDITIPGQNSDNDFDDANDNDLA